MLRPIIVFALIALAGNCSAQNSITVNSATMSQKCTVVFEGGQIKTNGCDFSSPLMSPRFTPSGRDKLTIEFDQIQIGGAVTGNMTIQGR